MNIYYKAMLRSVAGQFNIPLETTYKDLPLDFRKLLMYGSGEDNVEFKFWRGGKVSSNVVFNYGPGGTAAERIRGAGTVLVSAPREDQRERRKLLVAQLDQHPIAHVMRGSPFTPSQEPRSWTPITMSDDP